MMVRDVHFGLWESFYVGEFQSLPLPFHALCVFMYS